LEENSGIKGTLCLVGHEQGGNDAGDAPAMVITSPSPSASDADGGTADSFLSKLPTFSPTFNPTSESSTAGSNTNTQDPFLPPAGAMPVPPPSDASMPTYAPSTPIPTYSTYSPTYSTYIPTTTAAAALGKKKEKQQEPFIEPVHADASTPTVQTSTYYPTVDGTYNPTSKTTYYPTVDGTYMPTTTSKTTSGHDVASLIKRVKMMNMPADSSSTSYPPSTPFPTFDTYSPSSEAGLEMNEVEPKRRLLEVINLDSLAEESVGIVDSSKQSPSGTVDAWTSIPPNDEFFTRFPEWKEYQEEIYRLKHHNTKSEVSTRNGNESMILQSSIAVPSQLISAQFLEIDTSPDMTIINQDDSYLNLTFYEEETTLSYTSISATLDPSMSLEDQLDSVPGGAILVLIGIDESSGELVRNRLMWTYTMKCGLGVETVEDGDEFGWASFVSNHE
jgi:hypothetical protein